MGNGALLVAVGVFTLWIFARGYGQNVGNAWNTLIGAARSPGGSPPIAPFTLNPVLGSGGFVGGDQLPTGQLPSPQQYEPMNLVLPGGG